MKQALEGSIFLLEWTIDLKLGCGLDSIVPFKHGKIFCSETLLSYIMVMSPKCTVLSFRGPWTDLHILKCFPIGTVWSIYKLVNLNILPLPVSQKMANQANVPMELFRKVLQMAYSNYILLLNSSWNDKWSYTWNFSTITSKNRTKNHTILFHFCFTT
jgi:hypothetical protein